MARARLRARSRRRIARQADLAVQPEFQFMWKLSFRRKPARKPRSEIGAKCRAIRVAGIKIVRSCQTCLLVGQASSTP